MNISDGTLKALRTLGYTYLLSDKFGNDTDKDNAVSLYIGHEIINGFPCVVSVTINATKKETTLESILLKINSKSTFKSFVTSFAKLIPSKFDNSITIYPASYGIGIFCVFGNVSEVSNVTENFLNSKGIEYTKEYSEAHFVLRFKISKSQKNLELIKSI